MDLLFVSLFVWFSGGIESHFYLLFYLLVALAAFYFGPGIALATSGAAGALYSLASAVGPPSADWHYLGDLKMPKLSGQDLFNAARAISPAVEVIVITGQGTVEDAVEVMKEGAYDSITKRFRWVQLEVTIRKAAEKQALALQDRVPKCRVEEL